MAFTDFSRRMLTQFAGLLLFNLAVSQASAESPRPIVIRNATLIDGRGAAAQHDVTVIISDRHFTTIAPEAQAKVPPDAETIDATGKFVIPGL
ncbi:MAG TPA: hypothetical protein VK581_03185, partial [Chthoniobacterales bacterium]|nr:hypothetical protein [Chthoniobacterales bacterium]